MNRKVLIIEDDPDISELVEIHVTDLGYELDCAQDGLSGVKKFDDGEYDLVILDLMLPKLGGLEVCKHIREVDKQTPILMLTAKSEELDKVLGLELGADDYITKPFSIREFIARVKAIFRRIEADKSTSKNERDNEVIVFGELTVDLPKRKAILDGETLDLTAKEFDLLVMFASNPGRAYERQQLLDVVWGYQYTGYDHTVNSHINRLRSKLEKDPSNPRFIKTVWGVGYRFAEEEELSS